MLERVGPHPWVPVESSGRGRPSWQVGDHRVTLRAAGAPGPSAADEVRRLDWLRPRLPAPEVRALVDDDAGSWLVTEANGIPADRPELHGDAGQLVAAVADALRRLHALPVDDCPFDAGWDQLDAEVASALSWGRIDRGSLIQPFDRYEPERLVELWRQGRPQHEEPTVVHGNPELSNVLADGPSPTGLLDVGRLGVGDRHLDLAIVHQSIQRHLGPHAVFAFYDAYGTDPDLVRLEHYRLGALLR